jgi:hypothetical protein
VVGVTAVGTNFSCLHVPTLLGIAGSWVTSPILSGIIGAVLHVILKRVIIDQPDADQRALRACPLLATAVMTCMTALVMFKSPVTEGVAWWWVAAGAVGMGLCTFAGAYYLLVPHIRKLLVAAQVETECASLTPLCRACISCACRMRGSRRVCDDKRSLLTTGQFVRNAAFPCSK